MLRYRRLTLFALLSHAIAAEAVCVRGASADTPVSGVGNFSITEVDEDARTNGERGEYRKALDSLPSRRASFAREASPIIGADKAWSPLLIGASGGAHQLGTPSSLVTYLMQPPSSAERDGASIWAHRLSLPLVSSYTGIHEAEPYLSPLGFEADSLSLGNLLSGRGVRSMSPLEISQRLYRYGSKELQHTMLDYYSTSQSALMAGWERPTLVHDRSLVQVEAKTIERVAEKIQDARADFDLPEIKYRYWYPKFETSLQLSQNYISDNWYKGGNSNLNLLTRTYIAMLYKRKKIEWLNELEHKLGIYSVDKTSASDRKYRISSDMIRLRSNYGLQAFKHVYYTLDAEAKTQLFNTYAGSSGNDLQSAPFAPLNLNVGLGMKFEYSKKSSKIYRRKIYWSVNLAPLSFNYRSSSRDDIDLARHGLEPGKLHDYSLGSTLRGKMVWDVNMNTTWESRAYFNTSYSSVEAEWENTLNMKIGKYFSTRLNLHLRFDDSVRPDEGWLRYLQVNEILSFGFNYKL